MHVQNHERVQKFWFYPFRKKLKENPGGHTAEREPRNFVTIVAFKKKTNFSSKTWLYTNFYIKVNKHFSFQKGASKKFWAWKIIVSIFIPPGPLDKSSWMVL